jgi:MFS family permease
LTDFSIVNVALPSIEREFGFSAAVVQWVVTGYAIAFGGLLILGGRAADLFGRRRMFMAGLLAFSAASLAGGLAQDPVLLVVSRVVQGAGAAVVAPAAFSLITTGFAEGVRRNRALGRSRRSASWPARSSAACSCSTSADGRYSWSTSRSGWRPCCSRRGCWPSPGRSSQAAGWTWPERRW